MGKLAIIRSNFNAGITDLLFDRACQELETARASAKASLSLFKAPDKLRAVSAQGLKSSPLGPIAELARQPLEELLLKFFNENSEELADRILRGFLSDDFLKNPPPAESASLQKRLRSLALFARALADLEIERLDVPGAGEIPLAVQWVLEKKDTLAALAVGAIIRGQTSHYDFLCGFLQKALWDLQKTHSKPLAFSVLMTNNRQEAMARAKKGRGGQDMKSLLRSLALKIFLSAE